MGFVTMFAWLAVAVCVIIAGRMADNDIIIGIGAAMIAMLAGAEVVS